MPWSLASLSDACKPNTHPSKISLRTILLVCVKALGNRHLLIKTLPTELASVLDNVVSLVNYIKTRTLKSRLFAILCEEMGAEHKALLLHTKVRWLTRGKVLARGYELRVELKIFLTEERRFDDANLLVSDEWCAR